MTIEERIKAAITRRPERDDSRTSKALGVPIAAIRAVRAGQSVPESGAPPPPEDRGNSNSFVSLDRVRARYDICAAIERELASIPRGRMILEADLCQRTAGSDRNRFRRTVENNEERFRGNRIKLRLDDSSEGRWYWGHPEDISEAIRIRDL